MTHTITIACTLNPGTPPSSPRSSVHPPSPLERLKALRAPHPHRRALAPRPVTPAVLPFGPEAPPRRLGHQHRRTHTPLHRTRRQRPARRLQAPHPGTIGAQPRTPRRRGRVRLRPIKEAALLRQHGGARRQARHAAVPEAAQALRAQLHLLLVRLGALLLDERVVLIALAASGASHAAAEEEEGAEQEGAGARARGVDGDLGAGREGGEFLGERLRGLLVGVLDNLGGDGGVAAGERKDVLVCAPCISRGM